MKEINIWLLPSKKVLQKSIKLSRQIAKRYSTHFTLDEKNFISHISLYHLGIPDKNFTQVQSQLDQLSKSLQKFSITLNTFSDEKGYLSWDAKTTNQIIGLQEKILHSINPLREGVQRKSLDDYRKDYEDQPEKFEYIKKFGYPLVGQFFSPHITITRFKDQSIAPQLARELDSIEMSFEVNALHIGNIRENGTCTEIISSHALK